MQQNRQPVISWPERILALLVAGPWPDVLIQLGREIWTWWQQRQEQGMYEALRYASTLKLLDPHGHKATFEKNAHIRYLQNDVIAYQDQIWSDGEAPLDYRCSPGVVVDQYRPAQATILLISLRERKQRGEEDNYHIQWRIHNGFLRDHELWQTTIYYQIHIAYVSIIFPPGRPPIETWGIEEGSEHRQRPTTLRSRQLPGGCWLVEWELRKPKLHGRYNLHWRW